MRGKKARGLRKRIYKDISYRFRKYFVHNSTGQVRNQPNTPRAVYQAVQRGRMVL